MISSLSSLTVCTQAVLTAYLKPVLSPIPGYNSKMVEAAVVTTCAAVLECLLLTGDQDVMFC